MMLSLLQLSVAGSSHADEAAAAADAPFVVPVLGVSLPELALLLMPIIGYTMFNIFRAKNPKATFNDFLLIMAATFIVGNILSILIFKTSFY
eukprot:CAMPEP_0202894098 /NCGR_PEP_ID=MMETSP1392-20130828/3542_1 /ASSEMBLY_ACC=CAM_ASM_000868 /TAXON_ID=225041 /ORGANISM="Chlamydomonas chlamydogama, Strain SAG 11-48b" /LENGTH=91 /DNA_ID=CAMNT_0049578663 /DNA_START=211 /DNA_END=486 /DNA_ORIENTATION=-